MVNLKNFRVERGLTQAQMAEVMGCSQQHYSYIERGRQTPTIAHMAALYQAFGVVANDLGFNMLPAIRIVAVEANKEASSGE